MKQGIFDLNGFETKSSQDPITEAASTTEPEAMTLTTEQYKSIMGQLQKSFNEGVAIMDKLSKATVVEQDPAAAQVEYTEECLAEAYLQSIEDGPIFEAVDREDKYEIKEIVRSIRGKIATICKENGAKFYKSSLLLRSGYKDMDTLMDTKAKGISWVTTRLFQLIGMVLIDPSDIKDLTDELNEEFADKLGNFQIVSAICPPTLLDYIRTNGVWKNMGEQRPHMLLIDSKSKIKEKRKAKAKAKDDVKKESAEIEEDIDLLDTSIDETAEFQGVKPEYNTNKEDLNDETWNKQMNAFKKSFKEAVNEAIDNIE